MSDLISRQAAIDALHMHLMYRMGTDSNKKRLDDWINGVPSAQPERTGKWINGHWDGDSNFRIDGRGNCWFVRECSNCHEEIKGKPTNYCPNCGCRMKEGEEHD